MLRRAAQPHTTVQTSTVQFKGFQYVMTVANDEIFIVKKSSDDTRG
jgi:hypothetical protein